MSKPVVKLKRVGNHDLPLPSKAHPTDAGLDLRSTIDCEISDGCIGVVPTGFAVELPQGSVGIVVGRSGLGKKGLSLGNNIGVVDVNYRGEIMCIMKYDAPFPSVTQAPPFVISKGDRIAQLLILPVWSELFDISEVTELSNTDRGSKGFGSSGVK